MKTIVVGRVINKKYYMGRKHELIINWYGGLSTSNKSFELLYDEDSEDYGKLSYKSSKEKEETLSESYSFPKMLDVKDYIHIGDEEYVIEKVKYGTDGTIYYYVDIEYEDKESKSLALKQIELREAYLRGKKFAEDKHKEIKKFQEKLTEVSPTKKEMKKKPLFFRIWEKR